MVRRQECELVSLELGAHRTLKPRNERLRQFVVAWRSRARVTLSMVAEPEAETMPEWLALLDRLGEGREHDWIAKLLKSDERYRMLESFLDSCDRNSRRLAADAVRAGIHAYLELFSKAMAPDAVTARAEFEREADLLNRLYKLVGGADLIKRIDFALDKFDLQLVARRAALKARVSWKPSQMQSRVAQGLQDKNYDPGTPDWWTGKLNDAPEMLGRKLTLERAEAMATAMERSLERYFNKADVPRPLWANVNLENTYFSQGREPRVQFGELKDAPGVEGYLKRAPQGGPRVLEFPLENGLFVYLMFDGHHRAAAQIIRGHRRFFNLTVMRLGEVESRFGLSAQEIVDAIRDLHTHLYMTDAPVPR